ncbi:hypothetical protein [Arthrobacter globiformis]|uniref:hypothetical protein n=1 Tax=Arthrobacter globiformis TaxID=1665 RepID=UPI002792B816|nr:hypothetical protein [Arthrobacter globiformis]MDQ0617486.1 hypothetical protein [Arthrobacter globiformis]
MTIAALSWSALRPLRPVLLAGAAAAAWLAVSAPAADADNSHGTDVLAGSISSAVSSVKGSTDSVAGSVGALVSPKAHEAGVVAQPTPAVAPLPLPAVDPAALPASFPATVAPAPAEQATVVATPPVTPVPSMPAPPVAVVSPVVADIVEPADAALGGQPMGEALPDDTVAGVTGPVASVADGALTDTAETIVKPVAEAVKPVAEVVEPVTDVVSPATDTVELPVETVTDVPSQAPPLTAPITVPVRDVVAGAVAVPEWLPAVDLAETRQISTSPEASLGIVAGPSVASALPVHPAVGSPAHFSHPVAPKAANPTGSAPEVPAGGDSPSGEDRTPSPEALLPAPASGSGSGTSSGGPSASAAWLNSPFEYLPLMGFVPVSGPLQHVPSPVAIDPGSSPD